MTQVFFLLYKFKLKELRCFHVQYFQLPALKSSLLPTMKTTLRLGNRVFMKRFYEKGFSITIRPAIHNPLLGIFNVKYVTESQITLLMKFK